MRLLVHNFLICALPDCQGNNFPLIIHSNQLKQTPSEFDESKANALLGKIDWQGFV
jgi:hypothetical protein